MADFDDERIASLTQRKKTATLDRFLTFAGLALAGASAFFPWYVFFNADKFGINVATSSNSRELPDWPARNVFSVSPLAMVNKNEATKKAPPVDPLTTATVSDLGKQRDGGAMLEDQPFPGKSSFRLLHVSNGRALIEDPSGMYVVRIGSVLPDESRLAMIEQREGKWVIITSKGDIYKND
ncbi:MULTISPECIES: hypothetical protein [Rhizobium]|uniref:hypothetical protein n=1 Tax=Rhizobium TaxID=379 RepID=UPI0007EB5F7C|nr:MULTISPECIES: hypothetical protein [Rhizobium]ANK84336.1 hypothetical protein AMK02_CH00697 [Rhizobium sp. N731]ANK90215.1 hypothetical protein AMK01_CH00702 [Rhizobium sp. N6212]ANK96242.1 hypothetical protein AMK00_CH00702 [Rhizobium sp. N621]ANL02286.1 hypothetical protein AMJ99_CH00694 [Rhizobium esperanzae]ANL08414.1 hypothetical protein AMJ98_CH00694 [Rhizobium sp. N1341]